MLLKYYIYDINRLREKVLIIIRYILERYSELSQQSKFSLYVLHKPLIYLFLLPLDILHVTVNVVVQKSLLVFQTLVSRLQLHHHHLKLVPLCVFRYFNGYLFLKTVIIYWVNTSLDSADAVEFLF
jgi:hypothetical protein